MMAFDVASVAQQDVGPTFGMVEEMPMQVVSL